MALLGDLVEIKGGGTPSRKVPEYWDGDIPWATVKDFKGLGLKTTQEKISLEGLIKSASNLIPSGSIIVPTRMALGKVAINMIDMAINQDLKALRIIDPEYVDRDYLFRALLNNSEYLEKRGKGATVKGITLDVLKELEIPLPPLAEQKRIAAILDKADAIRRKRQHAIDLTDQLLRSLFLDMFGDPVTNPKGWPVKKMGEVIYFKGGSQPPKSTFVYSPKEEYVRLVQIRDFKSDKFITYIPGSLAKREFDVEDVMIARYGPPVFQILRGMSGSYNVALMKAEPIEDKMTRNFIFHLLQTPKIHDYVVANSERTAGQSGVNLDLLNNYPLPVPPMNVQEEIVKHLQLIESLQLKSSQQLAVCEELFNSLNQQAFRGELTKQTKAA